MNITLLLNVLFCSIPDLETVSGQNRDCGQSTRSALQEDSESELQYE